MTEVLLQNFLQTCCYRAPLAMANDSPAMTLDAAISKLSAANDRDRRGEDMLAAAQWQPQPPGQPEQRGDPDHAGAHLVHVPMIVWKVWTCSRCHRMQKLHMAADTSKSCVCVNALVK